MLSSSVFEGTLTSTPIRRASSRIFLLSSFSSVGQTVVCPWSRDRLQSVPCLTLCGSGFIFLFSNFGLFGFSLGQLPFLFFRLFCALLSHRLFCPLLSHGGLSGLSGLSGRLDLFSALDHSCGLLPGVGAARLCYSLRHVEQFLSFINAQVEPIREVVHGRAGQLFDRLDAMFGECGAVAGGDSLDR